MSTISRWCRYCGTENRHNATFCRNCGKRITPSQRRSASSQHQKSASKQRGGSTLSSSVFAKPNARGDSARTWRTPRFLFPLLLVFVVLLIGVIAFYIRSTSAEINIVWQVSPTSFSQQDQQEILTAWKSALLSSNPSSIAGHEFTLVNAQREGNWAVFNANERVNPNAQPIPTEPLFFIAHLQGTSWTIWIPSSSGFCDELKQVPDALLNATDKQLFC